jgi:hypothetical protein
LIQLNQANRGDLLRSPTLEKLATFIEQLREDPTALWYFFTIHDTILFPFVNFVQWKLNKDKENSNSKDKRPATELIHEAVHMAYAVSKRPRIAETGNENAVKPT